MMMVFVYNCCDYYY